jgi:hypothetical protein
MPEMNGKRGRVSGTVISVWSGFLDTLPSFLYS